MTQRPYLLFWKVHIFITTLFCYLNSALGPCAFFLYLRSLFSSFFFTNILSWFKAHRPQSPNSLNWSRLLAVFSRWVLPPRNLMLYRWPKQKIPNKQASRNMFVQVNFFLLSRYASNIELGQMKMQKLSRKSRRQKKFMLNMLRS